MSAARPGTRHNLEAPGPGARRAIFFDRDGVLKRSIVRDGKPHSRDGGWRSGIDLRSPCIS